MNQKSIPKLATNLQGFFFLFAEKPQMKLWSELWSNKVLAKEQIPMKPALVKLT